MKTFYYVFFVISFFISSCIIHAQWEACATGLASGTVKAIAVNGNYIYAGTYQGVYQSTNNGTNWTKKNNGISNDTISTLIFVEDKIFAGTYSGVFMSTDNGTNWTLKYSGLNGKIFSMTSIGSNIFAVVYNYIDNLSTGVFISTDYGDNWVKKSQGMTSDSPNDIIAKGNNLFLCTMGDGMFMSTDLGENWIEKNNGLTIKDVRSITINEDKIFIGLQAGGVYVSTDNGEFWIPKKNGLESQSLWGYALASYQKTIFLGTLGRGLFISSDFGENWILSNSGLGGNAIGTITTDSIYVYAGTDFGAFRARISDLITSVDDDKVQKNMFIKPNPAIDFIEISNISQAHGNLKIYSYLGQKVYESKLTNKIDVSNLPKGMYYMLINSGNKFERTKFVIMR